MKLTHIEEAHKLSLEIAGLLTLMKENRATVNDDSMSLLTDKIRELAEMSEGEPQFIVETEEGSEPVNEIAPQPVGMPATVGVVTPIHSEPTTPANLPEENPAPAPELSASSPLKHDLRKSLTINDRYLFCRELFDMSNNVLNHSLDTIGRMDSFEEAKAYVTATLELDPANPATEYFLSFISRHFK